jgi:hypothetical protein
MIDDKRPRVRPNGLIDHGAFDQRRAIERWEHIGWAFLHWTEVPNMIALMEGPLNDIIFIDGYGRAWEGPVFNKSTPVPLDHCPPPDPFEWVIA